MEFQDKILKCVDCGTDFVFTAGEQLFFHDKQFKNEPKRCKNCKTKRIAASGLSSQGGHSNSKFENADELLAVRQRDDRAVPADAGTSRALPGVLPAGAARGNGLRNFGG